MKRTRNAVLLIADGLGVGEMEDCAETRPSSIGSNSFLHVVRKEKINLANLEGLGMSSFLKKKNVCNFPGRRGVGKCALLHAGADSYEGHNEIMGNLPKNPIRQTMYEIGEKVDRILQNGGYTVERLNGTSVRIVDRCVAVADNMETDPGQVINVSGCLDCVPFSKILDVGWKVRSVVKTNRVITLGGTGITERDLRNAVIVKNGTCGLDTPKLNIYNDEYRVKHMGFGVNPQRQAHAILERKGIPVYLLGKMADVIDETVSYRKSMVKTEEILNEIRALIQTRPPGFIAATCQQTDLFGHMQDSKAYARVLRQIDEFVPELIDLLKEGDLFIMSGDHGNDPTLGASEHTREYTPFVAYQKSRSTNPLISLGVRNSLSDIAATICAFYGVDAPESGTSALSKLTKGGRSRHERTRTAPFDLP